jgi:hypothetical protein
MTTRTRLALICKGVLVLLTAYAWGQMILRAGGVLSSTGLRSLRYFTVLSNLLCGISAFIHLIVLLAKGTAPVRILRLSYVAAAAVGVTLMVVLLFLGPLYGYGAMLQGANLWFHLVIPLLAALDHWLLEPGRERSRREIPLAVIPTVLYGVCYLANILLNGVGEWPDTNDWYLFLHWGTPVGLGIFAGIIALNLGIAAALRALRRSRERRRTCRESA